MEIQKWIHKQNFDLETGKLFEESIICYKAEAYRAALLFSYLAFMTILKVRILNNKEPSGFVEAEWVAQYQNKLRDEGTWDTCLYQFTQQKTKIVFDISENLRHQIEYWKNRRNDCAHAKDQIIGHHHVESFWAFLYSNLPKLVVGGSYENLVNKIDYHFNPDNTPISSDFTHLIQEIEHAIEPVRLKDFFRETESKIVFHSRNISAETYKRRHVDFWNKILSQCNENIKSPLINYIKEDDDRLRDFIIKVPNRIQELNLNYPFAKNYWKLQDRIREIDLKIILSFVKNALIKPEDYNDLVNHLHDNIHVYNFDDIDIPELERIEYFDKFKKKFIDGTAIDNYNTGNRLRGHIIYLIKKEGLTTDMVKTLIKTYKQVYTPYYLRDNLIELFKSSPTLKEKLLQIIEENSLNNPNEFFWEE